MRESGPGGAVTSLPVLAVASTALLGVSRWKAAVTLNFSWTLTRKQREDGVSEQLYPCRTAPGQSGSPEDGSTLRIK